MKDFFKFLVSPYEFPMAEGWRIKVRFTFRSLGILLILTLILNSIFMFYIHFANDKSHIVMWQNYNNGFNFITKEFGVIFIFVYACIVGPLLEEIAFRLPFSFDRRHFCIGMLVLTLMISLFWGNYYLCIGAGVLICAGTFFFGNKIKQDQLNAFKERYGLLFFHIMALTFALLHTENYGEFNNDYLVSYLFPIGSILIAAYVYSYVRIRAGFLYAFALHALGDIYMIIRFL